MINGPNKETLIPLSVKTLTLTKKHADNVDKILLKSDQMASFLVDPQQKNILIPFNINVRFFQVEKS